MDKRRAMCSKVLVRQGMDFTRERVDWKARKEKEWKEWTHDETADCIIRRGSVQGFANG